MAHAGGRPTKYSDEIIKQVEYYISMNSTAPTLPTVEGLALHLGISDETVNEWSKEYPEFSATVKKVKQLQKNQLMTDGMYGGKEVNSAMAIFLLKANHGMIETEKKILAGVQGEPIGFSNLDDKQLDQYIKSKLVEVGIGESVSRETTQDQP